MSTTFHIIPSKIDDRLTFGDVLTMARHSVNDYLQKVSVNLTVDIKVNVHSNKEEHVKNVDLNAKFIWAEDEYAWFTINNSMGGTDAYCEKLANQILDWETYIEDTLDGINITPQLKQQILDCEYEWYFRRSAGQSPIVNIAYGHLAAAVAKLTNGYIYTDDGAWHDDIFPATADQLLETYFYPGKIKNDDDYDLTNTLIKSLRDKFGNI